MAFFLYMLRLRLTDSSGFKHPGLTLAARIACLQFSRRFGLLNGRGHYIIITIFPVTNRISV